jgi:hypothetical protein
MYSIYHFFKHLVDHKNTFFIEDKLEDFPFDEEMLSCKNKGQFPDLIIKTNSSSNELFTGGEFVELKDSKSYTVSSFNSTIPSGQKHIDKIIKGDSSKIKKEMEKNDENVDFLPVREIYYLIRGKHEKNIKVVLVHGSFFETIQTNQLIGQSFEKVLEERLQEENLNIDPKLKETLVNIFSEQENFSKVRDIKKASVKLRFRIMTEVKPEGNILNSKQYPEIKDNTINLIVPCHEEKDEKLIIKRFSTLNLMQVKKRFKVKHHLNGYFLVFQIDLGT